MSHGVSLEATAGALVGRRLSGVRYYMLPHEATRAPAFDFDVAHVADYGLDLVTPEGTTGVTWTRSEPSAYSLDLNDGPLLRRLAAAQFCSPEQLEPWSHLLGQRITACRLHWATPGSSRGPAALALRFEASAGVAVVCGSWRGPESAIFPTGDEIVVLWKPATLPVLVPYLEGGLLD